MSNRRLFGVAWTGFHALAPVIAASYAYMRLTNGEENPNATWEQIASFTAPVPFGHRILIPLFCVPLRAIEITVPDCYLIFEFLSALLLLLYTRRLLQIFMPTQWADVLAGAQVLVLTHLYLIPNDWPALFYPYDTPALLLLTMGLFYAQREQAYLVGLVTIAGAINRESAVLIPIVYFLMNLQRTRTTRLIVTTAALLLASVATRVGVAMVLDQSPRPYGTSWGWMRGKELRVDGNLEWLGWLQNDLSLIFTLGFIPLAYIAVRRWVLPPMRRAVLVALAYSLGLLFIGNPFEPRIFGEPVLLVYTALAVGLHRRLTFAPEALSTGEATPDSFGKWTSDLIDRFGLLLVFVAFAAGVLFVRSYL